MNHLRLLSIVLVVGIVFTVLPDRVSAQTAVYGGFSGASLSGTGTPGSGYGGTVGLYAQSGHILSFGGDFRGTFLHRSGFDYDTGALGPRFMFKPPVLPFRPYVEGLVGIASYNAGAGTASNMHLNYQAVAGLDATLLPHLDWRVLEYAYSGASGGVKANIFTTGLVLRLW